MRKDCPAGLGLVPKILQLAGADEQALNQFLNQSPWAVTEVQRRLARRLSDDGHEPVCWMVNETSFPKAGEHSVGAARQYCGTLGKMATCQVVVSLHWRQDQMSYPLSWRLFLPEAWCKDLVRRAEAHIPHEVVYRTKTDLALGLIDQAIAWDLSRGVVLADSFCGNVGRVAREAAQLCCGPGTDDGRVDGRSQSGASAGDRKDWPTASAP